MTIASICEFGSLADELAPELVGLTDVAELGEKVGRGRFVVDDVVVVVETGVVRGEMLGLILGVTLA